MAIHPTALVDPAAQLAPDIDVGPFAIIEAGVHVDSGCRIAGHAQILGQVEIGPRCRIGAGAIIGGDPQDKGFAPDTVSGVRVGADNDLRENVTIHRSTQPGGWTILGERNFLMGGAHLGHDCHVGDDNTLANNVLLAGHVQLGNGAFLGGACGVHQFVRLGDRIMVQGLAGISMDVPPYLMVGMSMNRIAGINSIGLRRAGFSKESRAEIKELFRLFYRSALSATEAQAEAAALTLGDEAQAFLTFLRGDSVKGVNLRRFDRSASR